MTVKKNFKTENPALQFIGQGAAESTPAKEPVEKNTPAEPGHETASPMKLNPLYIETKSRRLALLVQPSLHEKIRALASERGASVNETIHQILRDYTDKKELN